MEIKEFLNQYNILKNIKRFNMETVIHSQNLCDHGYNVGCLFYLICKEIDLPITSDMLFLVMNHDFAETYTGDLNRKIKNKNEKTKRLWDVLEEETVPLKMLKYRDYFIENQFSIEEWGVFHLADEMDAYLYCKKEINSGNTYLMDAKNYYKKSIHKRLDRLNLTWEEKTNEFSRKS